MPKDPLIDAIVMAAEDLRIHQGWEIEAEPHMRTNPKGDFVKTVERHLRPYVEHVEKIAYIKGQINELKRK